MFKCAESRDGRFTSSLSVEFKVRFDISRLYLLSLNASAYNLLPASVTEIECRYCFEGGICWRYVTHCEGSNLNVARLRAWQRHRGRRGAGYEDFI